MSFVGTLYRDPRWLAFRERVLQRDEFRCVECDKHASEVVAIQVHHLRYFPGRFPWDYALKDVESLCSGCHAALHGKVRPSLGWIECMEGDLGDLCGECEVCRTRIRYVYTVWHPDWPESYEVGCECCDQMTGLSMSRRERFVSSPRWQRFSAGAYRKHKGRTIAINKHADGFKVTINGCSGKKPYVSMEEAMKRAFDVIESGEFDRWRDRRKKGM